MRRLQPAPVPEVAEPAESPLLVVLGRGEHLVRARVRVRVRVRVIVRVSQPKPKP